MISGQVVAITASSGIGTATARRLAKPRGRVVLGARREEGFARLTQEICALEGRQHTESPT